MSEVARVAVHHDEGVVVARQRAREVAELLGFDRLDQTRIATAVSELARNARRYGRDGVVRLDVSEDALVIEVADDGPGIANLDAILEGRYRSPTGMGRGLIGVRLLMDSFEIEAPRGQGTRVVARKRLPATLPTPDAPAIRAELLRRGASSPYDEVTRQNEELMQALGEVRARQQELLALNQELEATNRGVVALYAELDDRAERLRDAGERKSRFLADMSHELRTPLNSIVALTELLLDGDAALAPEQAKQVRFIRSTAEEELRLVGDLLDIAKIEAGRLTITRSEVSVADLFATLRAQLRPLVGDRPVDLRFDIVGTVPTVHTDEDKVLQIMRNLIANALKFTSAGEVVVSAYAEEDQVRLRVADTGIGIAAADLESIFDEFVQVPGELQVARQGTGLGLPLSRKLAEALEGHIAVASEPGAGSTFTVRLPVSEAPITTPGGPGDLTGSVLVVDDDEATRYVVSTHLRHIGWSVRSATGGEMALDAIAASRPLAVVLDLTMPDLDGIVVLQRLRNDATTADLPVVVHTSRALDAGDRDRILGLGAELLDKAGTSEAALRGALDRLTRATHG